MFRKEFLQYQEPTHFAGTENFTFNSFLTFKERTQMDLNHQNCTFKKVERRLSLDQHDCYLEWMTLVEKKIYADSIIL